MDIQKIAIGTIVGGIVLFLAGWVIWGTGLEGFLADNMVNHSGLMKERELGLTAASCMVSALLLSIIYNRWAGIKTPKTGAIAGAVILSLVGFAADLGIMSSMNLINSTVVLTDIVANGLWGAIGGAAIGWLLGRGN